MKAVMLSVRPNWCAKITNKIGIEKNGKPIYEKTVEVRKTRPKIETPFKCYIYCTRAKGHFSIGGGVYATSDTLYRLPTGEIKFGDGFELMGEWSGQYDESNFLNGKVIGEFVCDRIEDMRDIDREPTCISIEEWLKYTDGHKGIVYGWHISDLVIYDKPKELSEFFRHDNTYDNSFGWAFEDRNKNIPLKRPPQSWCYVEVQR